MIVIMLGDLTVYPPVANFFMVYICQKLWKLVDSRQSYCISSQRLTFWATLYISSCCKSLPKLWKKVGSWQSYC